VNETAGTDFKTVAGRETSKGAEITVEAELIVLSFMFYVID
jgi:hypothetical protein